MKVINDSPNGETKDTDVIEFMEEKYPGMTGEFKKIQREQYELFLHKQHDYCQQTIAIGKTFQNQKEIRI